MASALPDYDAMRLEQLLDECAERGIDPGPRKGRELRDLLRADDE